VGEALLTARETDGSLLVTVLVMRRGYQSVTIITIGPLKQFLSQIVTFSLILSLFVTILDPALLPHSIIFFIFYLFILS